MFKRLLRVTLIVVMFAVFPLMLLYQIVELMLVCPMYYVIKGKHYLDKYYQTFDVYIDFFDYLFGFSKFDDVTFKRKYYYDN